jgi:4-amino-4-deoxy-L-arabinose transferase-like glycosyltransferase
VAVAASLLALALLPDYGPTWDAAQFDYPLGEALLRALASDEVTLSEALEHKDPGPLRAPHPAFRMRAPWWFVWPLTPVLSAASCRLFWGKLGWLDAMSSHLLPIAAISVALLFVLVRWMAKRLGLGAALVSAAALVTAPRFLADSFSNPKDAPEACLYTLAWLAFGRACAGGGWRAWLGLGALAGAALAQKINAVFLVPQAIVALLLFRLLGTADGARVGRILRGFAVALPAAAAAWFLLSPPLWVDPLGNLELEIDYARAHNSVKAQIAAAERQGLPVPELWRWDAAAHAVWTVPIPLLALAAVGLFARRLARCDRILLAVGAVFPVAKMPFLGVQNFDGVRHFLEYLPPLAALAGAGFDMVARGAARILAPERGGWRARGVELACAALLLAPGAVAAIHTHPNGVCYYNSFVGGLAGAQRREIPTATDYWANSYWQAAAWLRDHAEPGSIILVPIVPQVMEAIAPVRLRADLRVPRFRRRPPKGAIYVVYVTRKSFYTELVKRLEHDSQPVHEIHCDGAPILRIHRFDGEPASRVFQEWQRDVLETLPATGVTAPVDER